MDWKYQGEGEGERMRKKEREWGKEGESTSIHVQ